VRSGPEGDRPAADRDDIDFESHDPSPRGRKFPRVAAVAAALALAAFSILMFPREAREPVPAVKTVSAPPGTSEPLPGGESVHLPAAAEPVVPGAAPALPSLGESDDFVRKSAGSLAGRPFPQGWLATEGLIGRFVAAVDNIAEGHSPRGHLATLKVEGDFTVLDDGGRITLDPRSYRRYDAVTGSLAGLDAGGSADLYRVLGPLFQEAYRDLGYPDRSFDDTLEKAIRRLLDVPVVEGEIELLKGDRAYHFEDPALEGLSPAAKHLLRMGPANTARIQGSLRRLAAALGFTLEN
jgi:hypothetical protein